MSKVIGIKLTDSDREKWESAAQSEGLTLTAWIRQKVNLSLGESPVKAKKVNLSKPAEPQKVNLVEPETVQRPQNVRVKRNPCYVFGRHDMGIVDGAVQCRRCGKQA